VIVAVVDIVRPSFVAVLLISSRSDPSIPPPPPDANDAKRRAAL
jgi:hypothetical protein